MKPKATKFHWCGIALTLAVAINLLLPTHAAAQDSDDPPGRVARLGYMQGSISFRPAGEDDWVGAVPNRPMTTGDSLWADADSRAEVQLGSATIRLAPMTGFSFLNLNDNTVQIQLTSGSISVTLRRLYDNDDFEIDTPNLAFTATQPGHYRFDASSDGGYTVISAREGQGEADGGGQSFTVHGGQRVTFSGTDQLYADVESIYDPDDFDTWVQGRDHRFDYSASAHYLAPDVVGFEDLDDNGDWRDDGQYGHVWFPRIDAGWAPYHVGHWAWISPWGWTWVDDSPWGYAPFHYGRWVSVGGRWGWVAGPMEVRAVYAPALVVFIGGGPGAFGGNVGWFPLGPREVFVPSYHVSAGYMTNVNVSSTTVNVTQVTNIYNTTIIHNNTTIVNVTYANRSVQGAVMAVPQAAFVSAQPVAKAAVSVNAQMIASASVSARVAVVPTRASVLGVHAAMAGHVAAPPAAIAARQVVAKKTPPPPPVPFAKQQQALAAHPGQPLARNEVATLRPPAAARPAVKVAPPAKPATANVGKPAPNTPAARPGNQPAGRPATPAAQPNRPAPAQPAAPANRPAPAQPAPQPNRPAPAQPNNRPQPNEPAAHPQPAAPANRPAPAPERPENKPAPQPNNHPENNRPENNRPEPKPTPPPAQHTPPPAAQHPEQRTPPPAAKPAPAEKPKPMTPEEKKKQEEEQKKPQ